MKAQDFIEDFYKNNYDEYKSELISKLIENNYKLYRYIPIHNLLKSKYKITTARRDRPSWWG